MRKVHTDLIHGRAEKELQEEKIDKVDREAFPESEPSRSKNCEWIRDIRFG
jgi:hypothetical protein